jgi:hypothetical protein
MEGEGEDGRERGKDRHIAGRGYTRLFLFLNIFFYHM